MRWHAILIVGALVGLAGCSLLPQEDNPLFCCLSQASCDEAHWHITTCEDPARPFCTDDMVTDLGPKRTCVPDPLATPCADPSECPAERPFCIDQVCHECESNTDCPLTAPVCGPETSACSACATDDDCADRPDATRCLMSEGWCIECLGPEECNGATPVCDANVCRACADNSECASAACDLEAGSCYDTAHIIYVATNGQATGTCTQAAPCNSFALALTLVTGTRNIIKVAAGTYTGSVAIDGDTVTIVADDGVIIQPSANNTTALSVINGADASIDGVQITGVGGAANPPAVSCTGATSTLRLTRSTVIANSGGGINISQCQFSLVNNIIALNGSATSAYGGVEITSIATSGLHEFAFNTVTANVGALNTITGLECGSVATPLPFANNIVYGNAVTGTGAQVGGDTDCTWTYSDIGPAGPAGTGNIDIDPQFVDASARNFHLMSASPAQNVGDLAATVGRDIDNDLRPQGGRSDMGADEVNE